MNAPIFHSHAATRLEKESHPELIRCSTGGVGELSTSVVRLTGDIDRSDRASESKMDRTIIRTVVFARPFILDSEEGPFPSGSYDIETEEELIPGLSFQAFRRIRTTMSVPIKRGNHLALQAMAIDPQELEKALRLDAASTRTTK